MQLTTQPLYKPTVLQHGLSSDDRCLVRMLEVALQALAKPTLLLMLRTKEPSITSCLQLWAVPRLDLPRQA